MRSLGIVGVLVAGGCAIESDLVACGDGRACPAGTACAALVATGDPLCVRGEQLDACAGKLGFDPCGSGVEPRACYETNAGLVCLPAGCGNRIVDPGEACDDGNTVIGDGCSAGCASNETCGNGIVDPIALEACDDGDALGNDGCASACDVERPEWELLATAMPGPVYGASVAYDSARGRVVMFGGAWQPPMGIPVPRNETWEWDGAGWVRAHTTIAPARRVFAAMAYDAKRRRSVLFGGGGNAAAVSSDTWEWDGATWALRTPATSPSARVAAAAVYDSRRERVVLFGGLDDDSRPQDDTWEWDGTTWHEIATPGPTPRSGHSMVYDPRRGVIVLLGGVGPMGQALETWELDGASWTLRDPATPPELSIGSVAFDGTSVIGFPVGNSNTWRWNGQTWTQVASTGPPPRRFASFAYDPARQVALMFGGLAMTVTWVTRGDTWTWNQTSWTQITSVPEPSPRSYPAATYDALRGRHVVFGGGDVVGAPSCLDDTWELVDAHWIQHVVTPRPSARCAAAMAFDAARGHAILFGGIQAGPTPSGETWRWDGAAWTRLQPSPSPAARSNHALAYDPVRATILLFGGQSGTSFLGDTWEWNGGSWSNRAPAAAPSARGGHAMAYDPLRGTIVLFGGEDTNKSFPETWEWDGTTWTEVTPSPSPPGRGGAGLAWNGTRQSLVMFAGASKLFTPFDDTWELRAAAWTQHPISASPSMRQGIAILPARDGRGVTVFGGILGPALTNELWRLRWTNPGRHELCTLDVDEDLDGLAGCADPDCWASCAPLCPPGAPCDASWPRCGDGACNAALEGCRLCPQDCGPCPPRCGDHACDPGETAASCRGDC